MLETYKTLIQNNPISIATITPNGLPNIIVVAYAKVVNGKQILITDNFMNQTKLDIKNNSNVCLSVFNSSWKGLKILGGATYHGSGTWLDKVKQMSENEGLPAKGAILFSAKKIIELQ